MKDNYFKVISIILTSLMVAIGLGYLVLALNPQLLKDEVGLKRLKEYKVKCLENSAACWSNTEPFCLEGKRDKLGYCENEN